MARVTVKVPGRAHTVLVGQGAISELPRLVREMGASVAAIVTDRTVAGAWGEPVAAGLTGLGVRAPLLAVEPGERAKSLSELGRVIGFLEESAVDRQGVVVAVGGGTVGDLAGFAAAVWLRGVRCIQVPTTLLAMVDSSIGGKTAVNTEWTKNSVGAFWQPSAVVTDLATLSTLPDDEYLAGFAEIIKYGISMDAALAKRLKATRERLLRRDPNALEPVVTRCVELKAEVVAADERERGPRAILNYGHTVGHALEVASGFGVAHGRAVAFGMRVAARIAEDMGLCGPAVSVAQNALLGGFGLPGEPPDLAPESILAALPRDKKSAGGEPRWVLPREVGKAQVGVAVPAPLVRQAVGWLFR